MVADFFFQDQTSIANYQDVLRKGENIVDFFGIYYSRKRLAVFNTKNETALEE